MKRWLKENMTVIISVVLAALVLIGGAIWDYSHPGDSHLMTLSEMEELAEEYKAARDASDREGCE